MPLLLFSEKKKKNCYCFQKNCCRRFQKIIVAVCWKLLLLFPKITVTVPTFVRYYYFWVVPVLIADRPYFYEWSYLVVCGLKMLRDFENRFWTTHKQFCGCILIVALKIIFSIKGHYCELLWVSFYWHVFLRIFYSNCLSWRLVWWWKNQFLGHVLILVLKNLNEMFCTWMFVLLKSCGVI